MELPQKQLNPDYDHPTNELVPCICGYKPTHWSIYYSRTPYDVWCPHCKKQLQFAKCKVTGHHENAIDYWNSHLAGLTKEQMDKEADDFYEEKKKAEKKEGMTSREYSFYWYKGKGEVFYQRW